MSDQQSETQSIGQSLRAYREYMDLSIEDLAQELYISSEYIERIETDEYLHDGELSVFVRGYYRNYAKVVGYPLEQLENQLIEAGAMQPRLQTPSQQFEYRSHHRAHHWWRWLSLAVLIVVVIAFIFWFIGGDNNPQSQQDMSETHLSSSTSSDQQYNPSDNQALELPKPNIS